MTRTCPPCDGICNQGRDCAADRPITKRQAQRELQRLDLIDRPKHPRDRSSASGFFMAAIAVLACWGVASVLAVAFR